MKPNKSRPKQASQLDDGTFDHEIHELADAISECECSSDNVPILLDPFEEYLNSMRGKIFSNPHMFRSRLSKGYHILLHELENPEKSTRSN